MANPISNNFTPQNKNLLQPTKFLLTFGRIPDVQYFCQEVNLPGGYLDDIIHPTPFSDLHVPGTKFHYDALEIKFLVNEDLSSWTDIYYWLRGMTFPESFDEYANLKNLSPLTKNAKKPQYSDGSLQILSALNNTKIIIDFYDMFPENLTGINFTTMDENTTPILATASFRFSYFKVNVKY
jgi:hypothetical protein